MTRDDKIQKRYDVIWGMQNDQKEANSPSGYLNICIYLGRRRFKERLRRLTQKIEVGRLSCTLCKNPLPPSAFPLHPALPLQLTQVLCVRTGLHFRSEQLQHKYCDNPSTDFILFKPKKCFHMVLQ